MATNIDEKQSREATAKGALAGAASGAATGATLAAPAGGIGVVAGAGIGALVGAIAGGTKSNIEDRSAQTAALKAEARQKKLEAGAELDAAAYSAQVPAAEAPMVASMGNTSGSAADAWRKQVYGG